MFQGRKDHGDAVVADAQAWLSTHFAVRSPVDEMVRRSGLAERTFKRRFTEATGFPPFPDAKILVLTHDQKPLRLALQAVPGAQILARN